MFVIISFYYCLRCEKLQKEEDDDVECPVPFFNFWGGYRSHQVVKAFVILSPHFTGDKESLVNELQDHVKETTAPYKYPRKVFH